MSQERSFKTRDLERLVERRAKIGTLLLKLWKVPKKRRKSLWHLLLGVAFSLWRAAFLIEGDRPLSTMNKHAKYFLGLLLWDNAINYLQDRRTRAWTGGYYLNNANFRLSIVKDLLTRRIEDQEAAVFDKIVRSVVSENTPDLQTGWEDAYAAADIALGILSRNRK